MLHRSQDVAMENYFSLNYKLGGLSSKMCHVKEKDVTTVTVVNNTGCRGDGRERV
jgi:hypothetical protein